MTSSPAPLQRRVLSPLEPREPPRLGPSRTALSEFQRRLLRLWSGGKGLTRSLPGSATAGSWEPDLHFARSRFPEYPQAGFQTAHPFSAAAVYIPRSALPAI